MICETTKKLDKIILILDKIFRKLLINMFITHGILHEVYYTRFFSMNLLHRETMCFRVINMNLSKALIERILYSKIALKRQNVRKKLYIYKYHL